MKTERLWSASAWTSSSRAGEERRADGVDDRGVPALGEVRHRLERQLRTLGAVKEYYDARAPEYDEWWQGTGRFAERDRPGWDEELRRAGRDAPRRSARRTLDVACGTAS